MINAFEDIQKFGKENLDNAVKAFGAQQKSVQAIATEVADYSKKAIEAGSATFEKLAGVEDPRQGRRNPVGFRQDRLRRLCCPRDQGWRTRHRPSPRKPSSRSKARSPRRRASNQPRKHPAPGLMPRLLVDFLPSSGPVERPGLFIVSGGFKPVQPVPNSGGGDV